MLVMKTGCSSTMPPCAAVSTIVAVPHRAAPPSTARRGAAATAVGAPRRTTAEARRGVGNYGGGDNRNGAHKYLIKEQSKTKQETLQSGNATESHSNVSERTTQIITS